MDQWQCAINLLPVLLIENGRQQHSTASAIESFRNETVNRTDTTNLLLHAITNQTARIEPTQVTLLPEDSAG